MVVVLAHLHDKSCHSDVKTFEDSIPPSIELGKESAGARFGAQKAKSTASPGATEPGSNTNYVRGEERSWADAKGISRVVLKLLSISLLQETQKNASCVWRCYEQIRLQPRGRLKHVEQTIFDNRKKSFEYVEAH